MSLEDEVRAQSEQLAADRASIEDLKNAEELLDRIERLPKTLGLAVLRALSVIAESQAGPLAERLAHSAVDRYLKLGG